MIFYSLKVILFAKSFYDIYIETGFYQRHQPSIFNHSKPL